MSLLAIRIVDIQHDNKVVELNELTETALVSLIPECDKLIDDIRDAYRAHIEEGGEL